MQRRTFVKTSAALAALSGTAGTLLTAGCATTASAEEEAAAEIPTAAPAHRPVFKKIRIRGSNAYPVPHRPALPLDAVRARVPAGFHPGRVTLLRKGTIRTPGAMPLPCDIVLEEDVAVRMRDGTTMYTDVFRPDDKGVHPAIVGWSPYGKNIGGQQLDDIPGRAGVPRSATSGLEKFESVDPAFWVNEGYVVLNPDPRGAGYSEGDISYWGRQLAEDGCDFIEWAAKQAWCNGRVGMTGNSWLTVSQWFIAAEEPPHLAAIAPWEGFCDHYAEPGTRGGIPEPGFPEVIIKTFAGRHLIEDQPRMIAEHLLYDEYWRNMRADLKRIRIPAYVVASWTNSVHTHGSFAGFMGISSEDKWLRVNNTNEWHDFYNPKYRAELLAFFNRFLKGEANDFETSIPRVRYSLLDAGGQTERVEIPAKHWPLEGTTYEKLHLGCGGRLLAGKADEKEDTAVYDSADGSVVFRHVFEKDADVAGYIRARIWMSAPDNNDMDVEVVVMKTDEHGNALERPISPLVGARAECTGRLRASMRELDAERTTDIEPCYTYTHPQKLEPGEIVPLDIAVWPMGQHYRKGEALTVVIRGVKIVPTTFDMAFGKSVIEVPKWGITYDPNDYPVMEKLGGDVRVPAEVQAATVPTPVSMNHGRHVVHFGGRYDSWIQIPLAAAPGI